MFLSSLYSLQLFHFFFVYPEMYKKIPLICYILKMILLSGLCIYCLHVMCFCKFFNPVQFINVFRDFHFWFYKILILKALDCQDIVNAICDDDDIRAISFVGANTVSFSSVLNYLYKLQLFYLFWNLHVKVQLSHVSVHFSSYNVFKWSEANEWWSLCCSVFM